MQLVKKDSYFIIVRVLFLWLKKQYTIDQIMNIRKNLYKHVASFIANDVIFLHKRLIDDLVYV